MSITLERPVQPWQTHPGWGIAVDLTPPEVVGTRHVQANRRLVGLALVLMLLACAGVSLLVRADRTAAETDYNQQQARTADLNAAAGQYADITAMQQVTTQIQENLAIATSGNVDLTNLNARIIKALPPGMTINNFTTVLVPPVTAPVAAAPAADAAGTDSGSATDTTTPATPAAPVVTGPVTIGNVSLSGEADSVAAVTPYVSALINLRGITDVVPTSVSQSETGASFTITLAITDRLYTARTTGSTIEPTTEAGN